MPFPRFLPFSPLQAVERLGLLRYFFLFLHERLHARPKLHAATFFCLPCEIGRILLS